MIDWRRFLSLVVLAVSCGKNVPIENKACPCVAGYVCCAAINMCVRPTVLTVEGGVCGAVDAGVDSHAPGDAAADQAPADRRPPSGRNEPTTDKWTRMSAERGPDPSGSAVWSGTEMIVWGGSTGARYNPTTDKWTTMSTLRSPRGGSNTVWTGKEVIVWPGGKDSPGGLYDPATDSWRAMSTENAPESRGGAYGAVWSGSQMVIWGGGPASGGRYDPVADKWSAVSTVQAPTISPMYFSAFWIGREVFLWGGYGPGGILRGGLGLYDPVADSWRPIPEAGAPDPRVFFGAVFTGKEVIISGGNHAVPPNGSFEPAADALAYDVATERWRPLSTTDAAGSQFPVWAEGAGTQGTGLVLFVGGGGIYDPPSNKWWTMSRQNAPPFASFVPFVAVWTDRELLVWMNGVDNVDTPIKGGWRYRP